MDEQPNRQLEDGSRIAVIGGGPAGSFFSYFVLSMTELLGIEVKLDIYEPKDFSRPGPAGCNMCGGIVHESLVQILATEGINLPPTVVQRGIDSHFMHLGVGDVRIETPLHEKRIGALHRGAGPRTVTERKWDGLDGHLLSLAEKQGANVIHERLAGISRDNGRLQIGTKGGTPEIYDLVVVAVGVNTAALKLFETLDIGYKPPRTAKTYVREYYLGQEMVTKYMGSSVHVFLLNIPHLEFAALIPKGDYVTMCMIGDKIDKEVIQSLLDTDEVRQTFPADFPLEQESCQCSPRINVDGAEHPYGDRIVFIGDSGVTRFYKDGIGSAYRMAKAAASTVVFQGISAADFEQHYLPLCRAHKTDNAIAKLIFGIVHQIQRWHFTRRAVVRMITKEQNQSGGQQRLSAMMWDMYTGSSPYREILLRSMHPGFWAPFVWYCAVSLVTRR
ncbi:hypothetical protein ACFLWA_01525 [Chloroflexota bacterium]